ncbi:MAG: bifunctional sulfate adenylyltransferase/adenylylsulfate kinase [Acidimicrobiales bacterium]
MTTLLDPADLIAPHGGELVDLVADGARAAELQAASVDWPSWSLTGRQLCDLELLLDGGFSPLRGFLGRADYDSVVDRLRLADGTLWPIPITLDVTEELADTLTQGGRVALRDPEGVMLAVVHVDELFRPDRTAEADGVYGTTNPEHPGVAQVLAANPWCIGGRVEGIELPTYHDFRALRLTPAQLRAQFAHAGWSRVVAFQTRNPMHRAHQELTLRAAREVDARLLIHPVVGLTKPGDIDHYTRVRCYRALLESYPADTATLSLLPLAMRMAGPREAVWHAIIRKNFGATQFIVGRDHAGPGRDSSGTPFYGPYDAQDLLRSYESELGVAMVPFRMMTYVEELDSYLPEDEVPEGATSVTISGTELRARLARGDEIPDWFTFGPVAAELRRSHPARQHQGVTLFFTGLSGSGKSTVANAVMVKLLEEGSRRVTLLDGDLVRQNLSSELGFSREHRDINIRRIGYVAAEITKHGGIAICCPIAPYDAVRREVRGSVDKIGGFLLVHMATPLAVCEERDRKGLYAKARAGILKEFTGISDPYEAPDDADLVLDTTDLSVAESSEQVLQLLWREGYLSLD